MLSDFFRIKIYIPILSNSPSPDGNVILEQDVNANRDVAAILNLLKTSHPVGTVGNYSSVYELEASIEGYTPEANAQPTLGESGQVTQIRTIALITYAAVEAYSAVEAFATAVAALHPWEHPVIEIVKAKLWEPTPYEAP
jgi:hypothetical protein